MTESFDTVRDWIDHWADTSPDTIFLISYEGISLTFSQLRFSCRSLCFHLSSRAEAGDNIAYAMHNDLDSARIILGCLYGGFVPVAINLVAGTQTIGYVLDHSHCKLVFAQPETRELIESFMPVEIADSNWFSDCPNNFSPFSPSAQSEGLLIYTSGTTGLPKGVVHTHKSLIAGGLNTSLAHRLTAKDCGLCSLPFYHINAFCVSLMGSLVSAGKLVVGRKFSTSSFWDLQRRHRCTWFSVVPTQISYLYHYAQEHGHDSSGLESIRFGRSASSALSPDMHRNFESCFGVPIIETMGLTETAAQILSNPLDGVRKFGSPGIAYGNEVRIADENLRSVASDIRGEILVRGENVMSHYRNDPSATQSALCDGWFRTGDLGRMDSDGYVFVEGRLKELIIKGGENIAPREIDDILYQHKDVVEAACFGVSCSRYGERVEAAVKLSSDSRVSPQDLIALCIEKVGEFKSPDTIHILDELPKGPSGKIQRLKLSDMDFS